MTEASTNTDVTSVLSGRSGDDGPSLLAPSHMYTLPDRNSYECISPTATLTDRKNSYECGSPSREQVSEAIALVRKARESCESRSGASNTNLSPTNSGAASRTNISTTYRGSNVSTHVSTTYTSNISPVNTRDDHNYARSRVPTATRTAPNASMSLGPTTTTTTTREKPASPSLASFTLSQSQALVHIVKSGSQDSQSRAPLSPVEQQPTVTSSPARLSFFQDLFASRSDAKASSHSSALPSHPSMPELEQTEEEQRHALSISAENYYSPTEGNTGNVLSPRQMQIEEALALAEKTREILQAKTGKSASSQLRNTHLRKPSPRISNGSVTSELSNDTSFADLDAQTMADVNFFLEQVQRQQLDGDDYLEQMQPRKQKTPSHFFAESSPSSPPSRQPPLPSPRTGKPPMAAASQRNPTSRISSSPRIGVMASSPRGNPPVTASSPRIMQSSSSISNISDDSSLPEVDAKTLQDISLFLDVINGSKTYEEANQVIKTASVEAQENSLEKVQEVEDVSNVIETASIEVQENSPELVIEEEEGQEVEVQEVEVQEIINLQEEDDREIEEEHEFVRESTTDNTDDFIYNENTMESASSSDDDSSADGVNPETLAEIGAFIDAISLAPSASKANVEEREEVARPPPKREDAPTFCDPNAPVPPPTQHYIAPVPKATVHRAPPAPETLHETSLSEEEEAVLCESRSSEDEVEAQSRVSKPSPIYERLDFAKHGSRKDPPAIVTGNRSVAKGDPDGIVHSSKASAYLSEAVMQMHQSEVVMAPSYSAESLESGPTIQQPHIGGEEKKDPESDDEGERGVEIIPDVSKSASPVDEYEEEDQGFQYHQSEMYLMEVGASLSPVMEAPTYESADSRGNQNRHGSIDEEDYDRLLLQALGSEDSDAGGGLVVGPPTPRERPPEPQLPAMPSGAPVPTASSSSVSGRASAPEKESVLEAPSTSTASSTSASGSETTGRSLSTEDTEGFSNATSSSSTQSPAESESAMDNGELESVASSETAESEKVDKVQELPDSPSMKSVETESTTPWDLKDIASEETMKAAGRRRPEMKLPASRNRARNLKSLFSDDSSTPSTAAGDESSAHPSTRSDALNHAASEEFDVDDNAEEPRAERRWQKLQKVGKRVVRSPRKEEMVKKASEEFDVDDNAGEPHAERRWQKLQKVGNKVVRSPRKEDMVKNSVAALSESMGASESSDEGDDIEEEHQQSIDSAGVQEQKPPQLPVDPLGFVGNAHTNTRRPDPNPDWVANVESVEIRVDEHVAKFSSSGSGEEEQDSKSGIAQDQADQVYDQLGSTDDCVGSDLSSVAQSQENDHPHPKKEVIPSLSSASKSERGTRFNNSVSGESASTDDVLANRTPESGSSSHEEDSHKAKWTAESGSTGPTSSFPSTQGSEDSEDMGRSSVENLLSLSRSVDGPMSADEIEAIRSSVDSDHEERYGAEEEEDFVNQFIKQGSSEEDVKAVESAGRPTVSNPSSRDILLSSSATDNERGLSTMSGESEVSFMEQFESLEIEADSPKKKSLTIETNMEEMHQQHLPSLPPAQIATYFATLSRDAEDDDQLVNIRHFQKQIVPIMAGQRPSVIQNAQIRHAAKRAGVALDAVDKFLNCYDGGMLSPVSQGERSDCDWNDDNGEDVNAEDAIAAFLHRFGVASEEEEDDDDNETNEFKPQIYSSRGDTVEVDADFGYPHRGGILSSGEEEEEEWWKAAQNEKETPRHAQSHDSEDSGIVIDRQEQSQSEGETDVDSKPPVNPTKSFCFDKDDRGMWKRKRDIAHQSIKASWLSPKSGPAQIDGVAAAERLNSVAISKKLFKGRAPWKKSYKERTKSHTGYYEADVFSLYEAAALNVSGVSEIDLTAWENRDVKQRFLDERSLSFSRNWFGYLAPVAGNLKLKQPICKPRSMQMPIENIPDPGEWTEEWYTTWKSPLDRRTLVSEDHSVTSDEGSFTDRSCDESDGSCSVSDDEDVSTVNSSDSSSDGGDGSWDEPPECGEIINVKQRIGERITRVHPDYTSSLRRSRWRKKYFPRGTFPY